MCATCSHANTHRCLLACIEYGYCRWYSRHVTHVPAEIHPNGYSSYTLAYTLLYEKSMENGESCMVSHALLVQKDVVSRARPECYAVLSLSLSCARYDVPMIMITMMHNRNEQCTRKSSTYTHTWKIIQICARAQERLTHTHIQRTEYSHVHNDSENVVHSTQHLTFSRSS